MSGMTIGFWRRNMKKTNNIKLITLLLLFLSPYFVFSGFAAPLKTLSVQVKEGQVRSTPSFLGKIIAKPSYGDRVEVIQDRGTWKKVTVRGGVQGWMHASALTTKQIVLRAGSQDVQTSATGGEIALAGKGFSEEVEKQYKNLSHLDYRWVDRMEKFQVTTEQMQAFLKQGDITPVEGGAP